MAILTTERRQRLNRVHTVIKYKPSDIFIVGVDLWIGIALLVSSPRRESASVYAIARGRGDFPIQIWGVAFIALALLLLYTLWCRHNCKTALFERLALLSRLAGPGLYGFWTAAFFMSAALSDTGSFVSVGAYAYLTYRHSFAPVPGTV